MDIKIIRKLPDEICNELISNFVYEIQSKVQIEIMQEFLNYLSDDELPKFTVDNIYQYNLLNNEFHILSDYLNEEENVNLFMISVIINEISNENTDRLISEAFISKNLDFYLINYSNEMLKIPINSLYNIFNHKERVLNDHELAYKFIILNSNSNKSLFTLLPTLDGTKLTKESLNDCFLKIDEHFGFIPKADFTFIERANMKTINLLIISVEKQQTIDFDFIETLNNENSRYQIKCTKIYDHILYDILSKTFFLSQFDIIAFGGCDSFSNYTCKITEEQFYNYFIQYHNFGGVILFMHNFFFSKYVKIFRPLANFLGYKRHVDFQMYNNVTFNENCGKSDVISTPFDVGKNLDVANTHQTPLYDSKYTVLFNNTVDTHYYCENLEQNIADIEMGHSLNITKKEKKLFYNIICHLYEKRNKSVETYKDSNSISYLKF